MFDDMLQQLVSLTKVDQVRYFDRMVHHGRDAGNISDNEAKRLIIGANARLAELMMAREQRNPPIRSYFPIRPKSQQTRQQAASGNRDPKRWERKRRLGGLAAVPPTEDYEGFTEGQRAVLYIIAADMREKGSCRCTHAEIADRAGVGQTTVRNTIREADRRGKIKVKQRPQWRNKWLSNVITIVCRSWMNWLKRFRPNLGLRSKGVKKPTSTDTHGQERINGQPSHNRNDGPSGVFQTFARRKPPSG